jgi:type III pantothenate kinase
MVSGRRVLGPWQLDTRDLSRPEGLARIDAWLSSRQVRFCACCSVVPAGTEALGGLLAARGGELRLLGADWCPGLAISYPRPEEIGPDMLAGAIGAQTLVGIPALVLSLGTAVAGGIVSDRGFEGGFIAPGLAMMAEALHAQTALLPRLPPESLQPTRATLGRSTEEAIRLGCTVGFRGLVLALMDHVGQGLRRRGWRQVHYVLSGGAAVALDLAGRQDLHHEPHLNLIGLAEAVRRSRATGI